MDKKTFKKKIILLSVLLLLPEFNIRPYTKNFILSPDVSEFTLDKIASISRSLITFEINDHFIGPELVSLLKSKPNLRYNIIISGETGQIRVKNIKQISPSKIGYIVNEFIDRKKISELNMLKPHSVYLIYKRIPESFEMEIIREGKIRELTIFLDLPAAAEFLRITDRFEEIRLSLKPLGRESLGLLMRELPQSVTVSIIADSRIIAPEDIYSEMPKEPENRIVYETVSNTYYNNFLNFIKTGATELNIYYTEKTTKRDNIFDWILKTDP